MKEDDKLYSGDPKITGTPCLGSTRTGFPKWQNTETGMGKRQIQKIRKREFGGKHVNTKNKVYLQIA